MSQATEIILPSLYGKQHDALFSPHRYSIIAGSTKSGKTHGALIWQIYQCASIIGVHWWIAPVYHQAKMAFERAQGYLKGLVKANQTALTLTFPNGTVWSFRSGEKPDNLYGEDVQSAVVDEASRLREKSWFAVRSTLTATRGQCRLIGNVRGRNNWFYKLYQRGLSGSDTNYASFIITAWDAVAGGVVEAEEIEQAKADLPEHVYNELYLCVPTSDGSSPFPTQVVTAAVGPLSTKPAVCYGADIAKIKDYTVVIGLDEDMAVCSINRWHGNSYPEQARMMLEICDAYTLIDRTGVGDGLLDIIKDSGEPNADHFKGFVFSQKSKQSLMENLALAFENGDIIIPDPETRSRGWSMRDNPCKQLLAELGSFEYQVTRTGVRYEAIQGAHDDCVCALALALKAFKDTKTANKLRVWGASPSKQEKPTRRSDVRW